ncbi:hypothetical protein P3X46_018334 [Hevea brasiliensis]|uniref:Uncharacterized protein n=1 Tax=Hevea brasiliensis TaxID=3981 RepID=A0ABQ9LRP3_HEVBR|nr:hypothetical protein P3X46_018334 [Hevea brasiliensis]
MVGGDGGEGGEVVVVGVKFDAESRELLTWTLMKVAKPGDRVIALLILKSITDFVRGTTSLLSLVKTFDSLLEVYDFLRNQTKEIERDLLQVAETSGAAKVVVGTSKTHHKIRSSTSVPKHCARNLSKSFSVYAVSNGKIMFQREATPHLQDKFKQESQSSHKSGNKNSIDSPSHLVWPDNSVTDLREGSHNDDDVDNSLALVPAQTSVAVSNINSTLIERLPKSKQGWSILRQVFLTKHQHTEKSHVKKNSVVKWALKLPSWNSS